MSVSEIAQKHMMDLPKNLVTDWPFIIGFTLIEGAQVLVHNLIGSMENPNADFASRVVQKGVFTLAKFAYWDGFSNEALEASKKQ